MNVFLISHEIATVLLGLALLLVDLWLPASEKRRLGYAAAAGVGAILLFSLFQFSIATVGTQNAFGTMFVLDPLALFFKRFFLLAALLVLMMSVEFADQIGSGISEFYALILFALTGMMFAASANDFTLFFVSLELITVTFYVLVSFQRGRMASLEAGVKYLIIGALASAFMVFGIALIYGTTGGKFGFVDLASVSGQLAGNKLFLCGLLMVLVGLGFKIAAVPFQLWAPDVYQGAPTPTTAFLAVGSKAAGFVLLLRLLFGALPGIAEQWRVLLMVLAGATILYGNLCAIPQRDLKRLLGYSSISHAGYLLLGVVAFSEAGRAAVLFYLGGYLFAVLAAFTVICLVLREADGAEIEKLAGLHQRSPLLAATLTLAMVSLAGIPPLAGFFGKFLLLKSVIAAGSVCSCYYWLTFVALAGVVISLYYYFGVIRAIYWGKDAADLSPITLGWPIKAALAVCIAGMLFIGVYPNPLVNFANAAVTVLP
jgi:NADH-quinone oxidoreductase subunit N